MTAGPAGSRCSGLAVGVSGAGFFAAAVMTPWAVAAARPVPAGSWCAAGAAAVLEPALGLPFAPAPMLIAAFVLGLITQGAKITTDTVIQSTVDDAFRGRIFSLYDVLFNMAFVGRRRGRCPDAARRTAVRPPWSSRCPSSTRR